MALRIPVAHDFICPWCWVAIKQIHRLKKEFDVEIEWRAYELMPEWMEYPNSEPKIEPANKPPVLSRFQFILEADNLKLPLVPKPPKMRSYNAHHAAEYAKTEGVQDALIEKIYNAFWEDGRDINNPEILLELATGIVKDSDALTDAIKTKKFRDKIVEYDDDAYASGVYNVPTFFIGDQKLAERPYSQIRQALIDQIGQTPLTSLYSDIEYSNPHTDRPFIFINMVSTIDGKIITGERGEPVGDLGSKTDHFLMHRLEGLADAVLSGANSVRATGKAWNPKTEWRIVVTQSGNIPWDSEFMTKGKPVVITSKSADIEPHDGVTIIRAGQSELDWHEALSQLKDLGIEVINVLGGSEINAQLFERELVDELFLTLAPKIKLGDTTPTYAGGKPLPRELVQTYKLVSAQPIGQEVFLRYQK